MLVFESLCTRVAVVLARLSFLHHIALFSSSPSATYSAAAAASFHARILLAAARIAREILSQPTNDLRILILRLVLGPSEDNWTKALQLLIPFLSIVAKDLTAEFAKDIASDSWKEIRIPETASNIGASKSASDSQDQESTDCVKTSKEFPKNQFYVVIAKDVETDYSRKGLEAVPVEAFLSSEEQEAIAIAASSPESQSSGYETDTEYEPENKAGQSSAGKGNRTIWNVNASPWWPQIESLAVKIIKVSKRSAPKNIDVRKAKEAFSDAGYASSSPPFQGHMGQGYSKLKVRSVTIATNPHASIDKPETTLLPYRAYKFINNTINQSRTFHSGSGEFSLMSWNILSPKYCTSKKFPHVAPSTLGNWPKRRSRILQEILFYRPDIVCLQEVDKTDFQEYFLPSLRRSGYSGVYENKMHDEICDGCATFYREDFELISVDYLHYNRVDLAQEHSETESDSKMPSLPQRPVSASSNRRHLYADFQTSRRRRNSDSFDGSALHQARACRYNLHFNLALIVILRNRDTNKVVRVVNTHLLADPLFADAKLLQAAVLVDKLMKDEQKLAVNVKKSRSKRRKIARRSLATLICGDLNSLPKSAVLQYLLEGKVHRREFWGSDFGRFTAHKYLRHSYSFLSAYNYERGDMKATTRAPDFQGCVDYILYNRMNLRLLGWLGDIDVEGNVMLPNEAVPSDHLPLLCCFGPLETSRRSDGKHLRRSRLRPKQ